MTITYGTHGRIVELTLDDTVTFTNPIGEATQRLAPVPSTPRRPNINPHFEERRSFASPGSTGEQPLIDIDWRQRAVVDELQARFDRYATGRDPEYVGRHHKPGLFARLVRWVGFGRGRRDGA